MMDTPKMRRNRTPSAGPALPERPIAELVAERRPANVAPGRAVAWLRFTDKTFKVAGMTSGDHLVARKNSNGREHTIDLVQVDGVSCFLVGFVDPARRMVEFDIVERTAVRAWRFA